MNAHDIEITPKVVSQVRAKWPSAVRSTIRAAGKCPDCKRAGLVSYQTPDDWDRERQQDGWETCGWFCVSCGWSNAGSREIEVQS